MHAICIIWHVGKLTKQHYWSDQGNNTRQFHLHLYFDLKRGLRYTRRYVYFMATMLHTWYSIWLYITRVHVYWESNSNTRKQRLLGKSSSSIKGAYCFREQQTLQPLFNNGWFREINQVLFHNRSEDIMMLALKSNKKSL